MHRLPVSFLAKLLGSRTAAAGPRAWPPRARTVPGPPGHGDCLGASTPKAFVPRMLGGAAQGGPRHPQVTVPPPGNAAVAMARGRIQGSRLLVPLPELAQGQPEDIPEEVLKLPLELLGQG